MKNLILNQASKEINNEKQYKGNDMRGFILGFLVCLVLCLSLALSWILFCPHFKRLVNKPKCESCPKVEQKQPEDRRKHLPKEEIPKNGFNL